MDEVIRQEWTARYDERLPRRVYRLIVEHCNSSGWFHNRDDYLANLRLLLDDNILMNRTEHLAYDILRQIDLQLKRQELVLKQRQHRRKLDRLHFRPTHRGGHQIISL